MPKSSLLLVLLLVVIAGCAAQAVPPKASEANLPAFLDQASHRVQEAYQYAVAHPHELEKYPCFCGCVNMGHTSNLSCYIKSYDASGAPIFDNHASGCGVCVDITQDVMRLKADNITSVKIRAYIDEHYSASGPGTHTPLPTS